MKTPGERERAIDAWLRRSRAADGEASDTCLDAGTAAAWADGALDGLLLEQAQDHVADCVRCQRLMATLLQLEADTAPDARAGEASRWWRGWLGWAVPLTAAASALVAVALWMNTPRPEQTARSTPLAGVSTPDSAATPGDAGARLTAPAAPATSSGQSPGASGAAREQQSPSPAPALQPQAKAMSAPAEARETPQAQTNLADAPAAAPPEQFSAAAAPPETAPAAAAPRALSRRADSAPALPAPLRETVQVPLLVISPGGLVRWRLSGAVVERSADGGATWRPVRVDADGPLAAGSSPSVSVCWLVGAAGQVLLTLDEGGRWSRLPFPDRADLIAVRASDGRAASVTTADGRTFETGDGGATWRAETAR